MPKLDVDIADELPEPVEGQIYTIDGADLFVSQVRGYKGLRVSMIALDGTKVVAALWMREVAGENSKLGSFVKALGDTTEAWVGKKVKFVSWKAQNRKIEVVQ